jgi:hypothetical protein
MRDAAIRERMLAALRSATAGAQGSLDERSPVTKAG